MTSIDGTGQTEFDRDRFREVIDRFMSGVAVITTTLDGRDYGITASAMTSLSLDPPMLLVCLNGRSETREAITQHASPRRFAERRRSAPASSRLSAP